MARLVATVKRLIRIPILQHNLIFLLSAGAMGLTNYLLSTTLARRLPPGDYSQAGVVLNLLGPLQPLGAAIAVSIVRSATENRARSNIAETDAIQRTLFRGIISFHVLLLAIVFVGHDAIARFFHLTVITPLYFVVIISAVSFAFGLFQATLQERGQYPRLSVIYLSESIVRCIAGVTVVVLGYGITGVVGVYLITALLVLVPLPRPPALLRGTIAGWNVLRPVIRDIGTFTVSNIGVTFLVSLDVTLCRNFLDPVTADRYVALAALSKFFLSATGWAGAIAFRNIVAAQQRGENQLRLLGISIGMIAGLGVLFIAFCLLFGSFVMGLAFGSVFQASGSLLWITATSAVAISILQLEIAYFNAQRWSWYIPILLLGSAGTVAALPLSQHTLARYVSIYAVGTVALMLVLLVPMLLGFSGLLVMGNSESAAVVSPLAEAPHS